MDHRPARFSPWQRGAGLLCALLLMVGSACGRADGNRQAAGRRPAAGAEWTWLQQTKRTLDAQRARLAGAAAGDADLARRSEVLSTEFNRRLAELINADPPVQGEPLNERQQAAIRMKSDEDIRLARQFIAQGGDYQRAIEILKEASAVDPGYPQLRSELARTLARRYMTREAFARVKEGMDQEQVRGLLGQPNLHNVREYPSREVVGWFYPKDESGAAAAVWFHNDGGRFTVYHADFEALQPRQPAAPTPPVAPQRSAT